MVAARLWVGRGSRPSLVLLFQCSEIGLARVSTQWCCVVISRDFECVNVCVCVCECVFKLWCEGDPLKTAVFGPQSVPENGDVTAWAWKVLVEQRLGS